MKYTYVQLGNAMIWMYLIINFIYVAIIMRYITWNDITSNSDVTIGLFFSLIIITYITLKISTMYYNVKDASAKVYDYIKFFKNIDVVCCFAYMFIWVGRITFIVTDTTI